MKLKSGHLEVAAWLETDNGGAQEPVGPTDGLTREATVQVVTPQSALVELARADPNKHVRVAAVLRIEDQDILEEIACTDPDSDVCAIASMRLIGDFR